MRNCSIFTLIYFINKNVLPNVRFIISRFKIKEKKFIIKDACSVIKIILNLPLNVMGALGVVRTKNPPSTYNAITTRAEESDEYKIFCRFFSRRNFFYFLEM